jgi:Na+-transporting methylmalonyl-CoA/oxaloacetate decarboxylase gamma subunit
MFQFIGFLFIILLTILIVGLTILSSIVRSIFHLNRHRQTSDKQHTNRKQGKTIIEEGQSKRKKIFSNEEGEYIDFEEIKENKN